MPRNVSVAVENKFIKGLVTEATGLNFPENACTETENCVFSRTGEVSRRLGLQYETNHQALSLSQLGLASTEYIWEGASKSADVTFFVYQLGSTVRFWQVFSTAATGPHIKPFTVNLLNHIAPGATTTDITQKHCSFATGNGLLFISHPHCDPVYVEYNLDTDSIVTTKIIIKIRDTDGLPNNAQNTGIPMEYNHRPTNAEFNEAVYYNILNQGWYTRVVSTPNGRNWRTIAPLVAWRRGSSVFVHGDKGPIPNVIAGRTDWPSEADVWHMYKGTIFLDGSGAGPGAVPPAEVFSLESIDQVDLGNTPAGKGHYILTAFNEDRIAAATLEDSSNLRGIFANLGTILSYPESIPFKTNVTNRNAGKHRPSQIAFYAGRVWYSGIAAEDYGTKIYFTQILEGTKNVDRCYQSQDPTSDVSSDLLPSDGGVIVIPEIARIVKLYVLGSSLIVFATNGIWKISGSTSEALGFTANDFSIVKVEDTVGAISALSFVNVAGLPMWWNKEGIWTMAPEQAGGFKVASITEGSIQQYFDKIPAQEIQWVKGAYNPSTKIVQWLARSVTSLGLDVTNRYRYDILLNFDTAMGIFYPWTLDLNSPEYIAGIFNVYGTFEGNQMNLFRYTSFAVVTSRLIFAEFKNRDLIDWETTNPQDYLSFFITGYKLRGEAIRKFQTNYIKVYADNTLPSTFDLFSQWDYARTGNKGRWSSPQRLTMIDPVNYSYRSKRLKMRGHGTALQFKVSSVEEEPFNIIGWTTWDSTNAAL